MCAVKVVEGSGALCSALRLPGRGYRLVMPQRVCGRDRPVLHLVLPDGAGKPPCLGGRGPEHLPWLHQPGVGRCELGAVWGSVCSGDSLGQRLSVLLLSETLSPAPICSGGGGLTLFSSCGCQRLGQAPCVVCSTPPCPAPRSVTWGDGSTHCIGQR